jgi:predicted MFS family arabinose efflux permease
MPVTYRALLARPGAPALLLVCGLSWLSFSGYGLALILAVHAATRSFATAGAAIAIQSLGAALIAPLRGRLVDRRGAVALRLLGTAHGVSAAVLVLGLVTRGVPSMLAGAALLGLSAPPLIATARARWSTIAGSELAPSAHALNAALSDAAQIAAPPIVAAIALAVSPRMAVAVFTTGAVVAALTLAASLPPRPVRAPAGPPAGRDWIGVLRDSPGLRLLAVVDVLTIGWLSALELAVLAVAGRQGHATSGAFVLAAAAVGSITMSLLSGTGRLPGSLPARYLAGTVLGAAVLPFALVAPGLGGLAAVLLGVGAGFGLLNVVVYEALDHVVAPDRQVEAFTWLTTGSALGTALGSAASGRLAASGAGPEGSLLLAVALALVALVAVALGRGRLR